jgi:hypothetical protein
MPQVVKMQARQASLINRLDPDVPEVGPAKPATLRADENQAVCLRVHEPQPLLSVAIATADALGISVAELAGKPSHRIKLGGTWWASWQTSRTGTEKIASQQVEIKQERDRMQVGTITRGLPVEEGGYRWNGELRLWETNF